MTETYLSDERRMIQEVARDFTRREVLPVADELDPIQGDIPMDLRNKLGEMGYFGIRMPEEHGGLGLGVFEYCLISEELARGWMSVASIIARAASLMNVGGWPLDKREELTQKAARGEYLAAISLSEPDVGSDLAAAKCRAVLEGDEWVITGNKYWCTFADGADYIQLLARVEAPESDDAQHKGLKNFIIEKPRGELPEGCSGSPIPKIGYFGWKTWELAFDGCRIPKENIITGGGGDGFKNAMHFLNAASAHTAARSIGLARGALEDAMAYSHERVQFGVPIADFQETRFKIARMASEIEAARQLMYHAATLLDAGETAEKESAMVKWYASEIQLRIISDRLLGKPSHRATA